MYETSTNGQVLYIRHGTTAYNTALVANPQNKESLRINEDYLDCSLSVEGRKDALKLKKVLEDINIKYIFVSPLIRCLETAEILLKGHKKVDNIIVFVHPLISEVVSSTHDISVKIREKKEKFNNKSSEIRYDWKYFDEIFQDYGVQETFFFNFIDNQIKNRLEPLIDDLKNKPEKGIISKILDHFWKEDIRPESISSLSKRCISFKKMLKSFMNENKLENDEKILVITHSAIIRISSSRLACELDSLNFYPSDCYSPKNCEILSINIEE